MPLGLGLGISKLKSLISGLRVRFQGNATITAALDGILRDLSADFVSNGTVTAALEAIKLLDVDFSGDGTLIGDLADYAYLLDDYSGAAAAYSVRLLSSTYTGALVRIRRSSDNAEKDFYPDSNNELSLSSEDGASTSLSSWIGANNGFIVTWFDQSGNSNNMQNTTASQQPQIINAGSLITTNGKAALSFDGVTQNLIIATNLTYTYNQDFSVFLTYRGTQSGNNSNFGYGLVGWDSGSIYNNLVSRGGKFEFIRYTTNWAHDIVSVSSINDDTLKVLGFTFNGTNQLASLYVNSAEEVSQQDASWSNLSRPYTVQKLMVSISSGECQGYLNEVIVYPSNQYSNANGINSNITNAY